MLIPALDTTVYPIFLLSDDITHAIQLEKWFENTRHLSNRPGFEMLRVLHACRLRLRQTPHHQPYCLNCPSGCIVSSQCLEEILIVKNNIHACIQYISPKSGTSKVYVPPKSSILQRLQPVLNERPSNRHFTCLT